MGLHLVLELDGHDFKEVMTLMSKHRGVVINCFYILGPSIGGYLSDTIGRRQTMALGFTLEAILGFIVRSADEQIQSMFSLFVVLCGIFLMLGEVGPGPTVVLTASECFPISIRGQMMGLVAAWSKAGAAICTQAGVQRDVRIVGERAKGQPCYNTILVGSSFALVGALIAWFMIPDVNAQLDVSADPKAVKMNAVVS